MAAELNFNKENETRPPVFSFTWMSEDGTFYKVYNIQLSNIYLQCAFYRQEVTKESKINQ